MSFAPTTFPIDETRAAALQAVAGQAGTPQLFSTKAPQYGYEAPTTAS